MSIVFIGGSRAVTRLSDEVKERLDRIVHNGFPVVVGDAAGADKAVQKHLLDAGCTSVTVFCSGDRPRNNLGGWATHAVEAPGGARGFQFHALKDREMARRADFGLMIWDGQSPGTALNVLRLVRAGKKAVMFNVPERRASTFRSLDDWGAFLERCDRQFLEKLRARATPEEWSSRVAASSGPESATAAADRPPSDDELAEQINGAFAVGDLATVMEALGGIARSRGMSQVAKEAGLARESLYRSLNSGGNPEFSTVLKVMNSLGLRLTVSRTTAQ
jgi:adenine-specific DNA-methyltransferase